MLEMEPVQITTHHSQKMSGLKKAGLLLFFIGLFNFGAVLFLNTYEMTPQALEALQGRLPEKRVQALQILSGNQFDSKAAALRHIETALKKQEPSINDYDLGVAKFQGLKAATTGIVKDNAFVFFLASILLGALGGMLYILPQLKSLPGIKHHHIFTSSSMNRGAVGIAAGIALITFYVFLYWFPHHIIPMVLLVDPLSMALRNMPADQWFLYGTLYTLVILVMGVRMYAKYLHSRYHLFRTTSIMFFQLAFAFMIPSLMERLGKPSMDLKSAWPLDYDLFMNWNIDSLVSSGNFGIFLFVWAIVLAVIIVPVLSYFFGKRWYCSWVCGCGGLAETLGDPYRQLSDKSLRAWKFERISIHSVLIFAVIMTVMQIANYTSDGALFSDYTSCINQWYSFLIGAVFAGVIGTGFYPFMGNRVWCRFGCPLAAILGIMQRFKSRFRITTNGGQCISCGNCSTYCEMGIDVRWYAQRSQNIIRASCVGCGVCAAVCPRGVLALENGPEDGRFVIQDIEKGYTE